MYYVLLNKATGGYYYTETKRSNSIEKCYIWNNRKRAELIAEKMFHYYSEEFEVREAYLITVLP